MDEDQILEEAQAAFWEVITRSYPDVKSGEFSPHASFTFDDACRAALREWLATNRP